MSIKVMAHVWERYPGGGSSLLVMLALADWSDDDGRCWPSVGALSRKCRLSRSQTQRTIHGLIHAGYVAVEGNATGGAPGTTRRYRIDLDTLTGRMDATPTGSVDATGSTGATGRMDARDGSHPCDGTGSVDATQYTIDTSVHVTTNTRADQPAKKSVSKKPKFDPRAHLLGLGVAPQIVADFTELRRGKRAPITPTVIKSLQSESEKAGITLADALTTCCLRGWSGFRADWLRDTPRAKRTPTPENFDRVDYGAGGLI